MTEPYMFWALALGLVAGAAAVWFALGRLPRRSDDVGDQEREAEAAWISSVVHGEGAAVTPATAERVIELHTQYLAGPAIDLVPADVPPVDAPPADVPPAEPSPTAD
jgi:hypothetical protein